MQKERKDRRERRTTGKGKKGLGKEGTADESSHKQLTTHATLRNQSADAHLQMTWSIGQHNIPNPHSF